jgi:adenylylsulfate kinase
VTGLPASGKSTLVSAVVPQLSALGIEPAVLESDVLRPIFTPKATYRDEDRELFYRQMVYLGALLTRHGVPVIFDATANRRCYRDRARKEIPQFLEIYVQCPLEVCIARDPKGIYRKAREGAVNTVPGLQTVYEPPEAAEIIVRSGEESHESAVRRIVAKLRENQYITT